MNTLNSLYNFVESWIEISSQPSSSSISSAATDHSTVAARRLEHSAFARRRRRLNRAHSLPYESLVRPASTTGSSQEEYEESESESDRIMTSSNEGLARNLTIDVQPAVLTSSASGAASADEDGEEEDDGDNHTALGEMTTEPAFTPQPNVFSHPPRSQSSRRAGSEEPQMSYFQHRRQSNGSRPAASSYPHRKSNHHMTYGMTPPSPQADHDAALRASLSTLLSCAAAARALPKKESQVPHGPVERFEDPPPAPAPRPVSKPPMPVEPLKMHQRPALLRVSSSSMYSFSSSQKHSKRKASSSKDRQQNVKRKRRSSLEETLISPTLMTWMVSAGVVAIFSALSFSAGYVLGREVGRLEAAGGAAAFPSAGTHCGKEVGRGLKRLRWSSTSNSLLKA